MGTIEGRGGSGVGGIWWEECVERREQGEWEALGDGDKKGVCERTTVDRKREKGTEGIRVT